MCEICSMLTIKTQEKGHWRRSAIFIVNFEQIARIVSIFIVSMFPSKCRLRIDVT